LPQRRAGILSQGSFILAHSGEVDTNPIRRGSFVIRHLLCGVIPDPPPGIEEVKVMLTKDSTVEDQYPQHRLPGCKHCHVFMNPLGFGFEDVDAVGKLRTSDNGKPIDSKGYILNTTTDEKTEFGPGEVYKAVAEAPDTASCFVLRAFQYALGRAAGKEDRPRLLDLAKRFRANEMNVVELFADIIASESFAVRAAP
jgi:hypothetical protein